MKIIPLLLIILFSLSGCLSTAGFPASTLAPEETKMNLNIETHVDNSETPLPVALTATTTIPPNTITPTPIMSTPTPAIPAEARLQIRQLQLFTTFPGGYTGKGYVVLNKLREHSHIAIDLSTQKTYQIREDKFGILSPDEKWIIHLVNTGDVEPAKWTYELISEQGIVRSVFSVENGWMLRDAWADNQHILADKKVTPDILVYQTMVINPFTGQMNLLPFDYPDIYKFTLLMNYNFNVYDPSLRYVIYPASITDDVPGQILRDVSKRRNIVSIPATLVDEPVWSPDGTMFAISSGNFNSGISVVHLNGEIEKLTHVEAYNGRGIDSQYIRWSPDGRKIAFTMSPSKDPTNQDNHCLAILDVATEAVAAYCATGFDILGDLSSFRILWSPDSRQVLVEGYTPDSIHSVGFQHNLLIDLEKQIAIDLGGEMEKTEPVYFISSLPPVWVAK
jgi:hypothetical protein